LAGQSADASPYRRIAAVFYSKLARASALMFAGTMAGGVLGYVFQVLMGRLLSATEFGLFSAMMAFFAVVSAPLGTLLLVVGRRVSEYNARHDAGSVRHFYFSISGASAVAGALILAASLLLSAQLQAYLRSPSAMPVYLVGLLLFASFFPIVNEGFLQGLQRFTWLSASGTLRILLRIFFATLLVWLGEGVSGAIGGTILAAVAGWAITYLPLHRVFSAARGLPFETAHLALAPAIPVLIANTAFAAMTQLDMVLVNYYFPPHEASLYAAASILGKAVMYLPGGIAMALFPMVAENQARDRSSAHLLLQAVGLAGILSLLGAVVYFVLGERIVALFFGEDYRAAGHILQLFGFAILPMALVMVAEYFLIAKGRVLFAYLLLLSAPVQVGLIHLFHDSLETVVVVVGGSGAVVAFIGYALLWRAFRRS
jgi:O-antigen/teichoic acid export membrane protein